jgi:hypothetical protein
MNNLLILALKSCFADLSKKIKGTLLPGSHYIDETITIRVVGEVLKSENEMFKPTVKIPQKTVLALLLPYLGATRESAIQRLVWAVNQAIDLDSKADETIKSQIKDVDSAFDMVESRVIDALQLCERDGKTNVKCEIMIVPSPVPTSVP